MWLCSFRQSGKSEDMAEDILIFGLEHRNRAVHGDTVVVEMLPKLQWRSRSNAIKENDDSSDCKTTRLIPIHTSIMYSYIVSC